jgi:hypothetical protein
VAEDTSRAVLVVAHDHRTLGYGDRLIIEDGKIVGRQDRRPGAPVHRPGRRAAVALVP